MNSGAGMVTKKRKVFSCFRPVEIQGPFKHGRRLDGSSQPPVGEKEGQVFRRMSPAGFSPNEDDGGSFRRRKKCGRGGFFRSFKLILFETSLAMKIRNRKGRKNPNSMAKYQDLNLKNEFTRDDDRKIISKTLSSSSSRNSAVFTSNSLCSSCSSSRVLNSRFSSDPHDKSFRPNTPIDGLYGSRNRWFWLLICLSCLIFWGKFCALFSSLAWLFFVLNGRNLSVSVEKKMAAFDSQEYKKKVIMEGLIDRDRSSVLVRQHKKKDGFF